MDPSTPSPRRRPRYWAGYVLTAVGILAVDGLLCQRLPLSAGIVITALSFVVFRLIDENALEPHLR